MENSAIKSLLLELYEKQIAPIEEKYREREALLHAVVEAARGEKPAQRLEEVVAQAVQHWEQTGGHVEQETHIEKIYRAHLEWEENGLNIQQSLKERQRNDTANWWRHRRLWEPVFDCLSHTKNESWLTVGDTFGSDAFQMIREGFADVLATSIGPLPLEEAKRQELIPDFRVENAEALSFSDASFDYVLCREALHHFPRPMLALYEMLRVARKGVVLIEPQDPAIDHPVHTEIIHGYETVGNYVYTISRRELEKVTLGLDLPALATRGLFDHYYEGVEEVPAREELEEFHAFRQKIEEGENQCALGLQKPNYLLAVMYKQRIQQSDIVNFNGRWKIVAYPGNPFLKK